MEGFFCNKTCATIYNNTEYKTGESHPNYINGVGSYRKRALTKYGEKCIECGYDKVKAILEVHHKDRDRTNNEINNLEVLCPTCHMAKHYKTNDGRWTLRHNNKESI